LIYYSERPGAAGAKMYALLHCQYSYETGKKDTKKPRKTHFRGLKQLLQ